MQAVEQKKFPNHVIRSLRHLRTHSLVLYDCAEQIILAYLTVREYLFILLFCSGDNCVLKEGVYCVSGVVLHVGGFLEHTSLFFVEKKKKNTSGTSLSGNFSHFGTWEYQQRFEAGKSLETFF